MRLRRWAALGVGGPSPKWLGAGTAAARRGRSARGALEGHLPRRPAPPPHRSHRLHEGQQGGRPPVLVARWHLIPTTSPTTSSEDWSVRRSPEAHVRRLASQVEALGLNASTTPARPQLEPSPLDLGASPRDAGAPISAATTALSSAPSAGGHPCPRRWRSWPPTASQPLSASAPGAAPRWRRRGPGRCRRRRPAPGRSSPQHRAQPAALALAVGRSPAGALGPAP